MEKIKILFVSANPAGMPQLKLDKEAREIEAKVRAAEYRDSLELITKWAVRPDDLLHASTSISRISCISAGTAIRPKRSSSWTNWASPSP